MQQYTKFMTLMEELAVKLGVPQGHVTTSNIGLKIQSTINKFYSQEEKAQELGYKSVEIALKALSQMKDRQVYSVEAMPEVFHTFPHLWIQGIPSNKNTGDKGIARMRVRDAQLEYDKALPWLIRAWNAAEMYENAEEIRAEIEAEYLTTFPDDFGRYCYRVINDIEPVEPHEEFDEMHSKDPTRSELREALEGFSIMETDYGVGGEMDDVVW